MAVVQTTDNRRPPSHYLYHPELMTPIQRLFDLVIFLSLTHNIDLLIKSLLLWLVRILNGEWKAYKFIKRYELFYILVRELPPGLVVGTRTN